MVTTISTCGRQLPSNSNFYISMTKFPPRADSYPRASSIATDNNRYYLPWHTRVIGSIEARSQPHLNRRTLSNCTDSSKLQISNRSLPAHRGKYQSQHAFLVRTHLPAFTNREFDASSTFQAATTAEPRLMIHEQATAFGMKDTPLVAAHTNTIINVLEDALHTHE